MTSTLTRDRRIEARADAETAELIHRAAKLSNETVSTFVVDAAREKAEKLIGRADRTFMPAEMFDEIMISLNEHNPVPELEELFSRQSRISRK